MKMTNEEMGIAIDVMSNLNESGKLGYAIARNTRKMTDAAKEYLDMRSKLFQKYGTINGTSATINGADNIKKYQKEMGDIPKLESDVEIFKVSPEEFYSGHLTSSQMTALLWMVEGEGEEI